MGPVVWDLLDRYLAQDRVWPSPDGSEMALEAMSPAHRLCALIALEEHASTPLVRRLHELAGPLEQPAGPERAGPLERPARPDRAAAQPIAHTHFVS